MILGKKIGMTRVFNDQGMAVPVTVIEAGPCVVVQRKTTETDGYSAVQVGFMEKSRSRTNSPMTGHFETKGISPKRYLREFRMDDDSAYEQGQTLTVEVFADCKEVDIQGTSKGKGFAGGMKRHGFHGAPGSHGHGKVRRKSMSAGATDAARVFKGKRSPGHMGAEKVTTKGLAIVEIDPERNVLLVKGAVPGANGGVLAIRGR